jgi:hypothetical protein
MIDTFAESVMHTFKSAPGDTMECRCCHKQYERGDWDFYSLCDPCFANFDRIKMQARFGMIAPWLKEGKLEYNMDVEDVELFIKSGTCPHT